MSKYLEYYGKRIASNQTDDAYGAWYDIINPFTALDSYKQKGLSMFNNGAFFKELGDYSEVRDTISNRPLVLRNAAKKLKAVPFNQSKKKKITNYRNSGWSNIISITPTSVAESYAIVGAMYYLVGNVYQSQKMIGFGDQFINKSKNSSADKNIKDSLSALNKGIKKLNDDAKSAGISPAWYNIVGKIKKSTSGDTALNSVNKFAKALNAPDEIAFAEAMRNARMEDESPMGALLGVLGVMVLVGTAPLWIPAAAGALPTVTRIASSGAKSAARIATKGAKSTKGLIGKGTKKATEIAKSKATNAIQETTKNIAETAKKAIEDFDVEQFSKKVNDIVGKFQKQGAAPSQKALMQSQEMQKMFQKFLQKQDDGSKEATKKEMRKLLAQLLQEMKTQGVN